MSVAEPYRGSDSPYGRLSRVKQAITVATITTKIEVAIRMYMIKSRSEESSCLLDADGPAYYVLLFALLPTLLLFGGTLVLTSILSIS